MIKRGGETHRSHQKAQPRKTSCLISALMGWPGCYAAMGVLSQPRASTGHRPPFPTLLLPSRLRSTLRSCVTAVSSSRSVYAGPGRRRTCSASTQWGTGRSWCCHDFVAPDSAMHLGEVSWGKHLRAYIQHPYFSQLLIWYYLFLFGWLCDLSYSGGVFFPPPLQFSLHGWQWYFLTVMVL